jgi:hypothetical protein
MELGVVEGGQFYLSGQIEQPGLNEAVNLRLKPRLSPGGCGLEAGACRDRPDDEG